MTPTPETSDISRYTPIVSQKNHLLSKWNLVFTKSNGSPWISFKPQLGLSVYPCYACRDMFASKITFQDHTNRRAFMIKYDCKGCNQSLTFYNPCSFLLHARSHFSLAEGKIDLNLIEIFSLPFGMMGFLPHPGILTLYDVEEDLVDEDYYINTQFYGPDASERGKQIITLKPNDLLFCWTAEDSSTKQLTLKQISNNIPLCHFITLEDQKRLRESFLFLESSVRVKEEVADPTEIPEVSPPSLIHTQYHLPVISKIESLSSEEAMSTYPRCPECSETQRCPMKMHFIGKNIPFDENFKCPLCKYVASTKCSSSAHQRIHANVAPFICPECGKKFESRDYLMDHLDEVCFHLAKQVRIRCPGKKCGKLFASPATFVAHFAQHICTWVQCNVCKECFESMMAFSEHAKIHSHLCYSDKVYKCLGCKNEESIIYEENVQQHIEYHSTDRSRCMYVFICKFCKNYFRSTLTYATHLLKCQKNQSLKKQAFPFSLDSCKQCHNRIIFYENESSVACSKCRYLNFLRANVNPKPIANQAEKAVDDEIEVNVCVLCKKEIPDNEVKSHPSKCMYRDPKIVVKKLDEDKISSSLNTNSDNSVDSIIESENTDQFAPQKSSSSMGTDDSVKLTPKSQDGMKRKRKRASFAFRGKKPMLSSPPEEIIDLQAGEATLFDGTYYCKLCNYQETEREKFHHHIVTHRDISTAYQCMECGECFVVKPSLIKHLMHYHKIEDTNDYLESNDCYDKSAVEELKEIMKLAPGESRGPVKENQCRVCMQQFSDGHEFNKHFRIHGMAFLMKNTRD